MPPLTVKKRLAPAHLYVISTSGPSALLDPPVCTLGVLSATSSIRTAGIWQAEPPAVASAPVSAVSGEPSGVQHQPGPTCEGRGRRDEGSRRERPGAKDAGRRAISRPCRDDPACTGLLFGLRSLPSLSSHCPKTRSSQHERDLV